MVYENKLKKGIMILIIFLLFPKEFQQFFNLPISNIYNNKVKSYFLVSEKYFLHLAEEKSDKNLILFEVLYKYFLWYKYLSSKVSINTFCV